MVDSILLCQGNGIIQILCILTVNGDCNKVSEIQSSIQIRLLYMVRHTVSLTKYFVRKYIWYVKALHNSKDICSR